MSEEEAPLGPALPPGFRTVRSQRSADDCERRRGSKPTDHTAVAGPALPPGFRSRKSSESSDSDEEGVRCTHEKRETGPALASDLMKSSKQVIEKENSDKSKPRGKQTVIPQEQEKDEDDGFFGPALPPGFPKKQQSPDRPFIGPALPPGFRKPEEEISYESLTAPAVSPSLSRLPTENEREDENVIGPMPSMGPNESNIAMEIELRAKKMKERLISGNTNEGKKETRESWMTELPPELQNIGLGARTFKKRSDEGSRDRSIWTDTPADKEKKEKDKEMVQSKDLPTKEPESVFLSDRDKRMAKEVAVYNETKRSESLLDMHSKKLKRKASEEEKPQERRAFDRDQDLQVHQFDEAQKKALIKKSRELNTRFSHGKSNMFL
ncbi:GPALPP motifs-containing protein 1 [Callorhinchus milii]|uniref:GPALPP motifs-containing protein 1 n=1 Tax=Callorhinchus milii TaxID=7868 RepID=V9KXE9_CALMI|nr:GPALPP motifs-containing protein 1 [Callorhinchus milii]|eukprot:gi/632949024/ref/XP_007889919.1/ PREDICTED: GPALPP motifs-containing protein 1 [Callorhinchus milii]